MAESLFNKLRKNTVIDKKILQNSKYFDKDTLVSFDVPILNLAASGTFDGGLAPGILMIAAPPKHFKSNLMLQAMLAFQKKHKDKENVIIFYDSEFGTPDEYYSNAGIDISEGRFDRRPVTTVETFRSDIANLLNDISVGDNVLICLDSLGMLASNKEVNDAIEGHDKADMTRAKQIKSTFRIITPQLTLKGIPMIVINHTYQTMDMYPEEVAAGGRGAQYAGHTLWNIGKRQIKEGTELSGFDFVIRIKFSRYIKEKSEFNLTVTYDNGIERYSGIFDLALEHGSIVSEKQGWYLFMGGDKPLRRSAIENDKDMMEKLLHDPTFRAKVEDSIRL